MKTNDGVRDCRSFKALLYNIHASSLRLQMTFWNTKRVELALDRHVKSAVSLATSVTLSRP